jgi:hypothetical protein
MLTDSPKVELVERLVDDERTVKFDSGDSSFLRAYSEFLHYFADRPTLTEHDLIVGAHFSYGWMPTILHCSVEDLAPALTALNLARDGSDLDAEQLGQLQRFVNGSITGASKLLHFVQPSLFSIFDSRVDRYRSTGKSRHYYQINEPKQYIACLSECREAASHVKFASAHASMQKKVGYPITPLRAVELIMYTKGARFDAAVLNVPI